MRARSSEAWCPRPTRSSTSRSSSVVGVGGNHRLGAMEYAFENAELTATRNFWPSVFTRAVVEGLETETPTDQDGYVCLDELYVTTSTTGCMRSRRTRRPASGRGASKVSCTSLVGGVLGQNAGGPPGRGCSSLDQLLAGSWLPGRCTPVWRLPGSLLSRRVGACAGADFGAPPRSTIAERSQPHRPPHWIPIRSRPAYW